MAKTATLNVRIDADLKADAEAVFRKLQLSPTTAMRLFYAQVALRRGLPFDVHIPNKATRAAMAELDRGGGKVYRARSGRALTEAILNDE
jgi:DNA-damage-inducible protein J